MALEGYDLVMLGILAAAAVLGYFKGMVWQLAWIAGIVASCFLALRFSGPLAPFFGQQAPWNRPHRDARALRRHVAGRLARVPRDFRGHQRDASLGLRPPAGPAPRAGQGALLCVVVTFFAVTLAPAYRDQIVGQPQRPARRRTHRARRQLPAAKDIHDTVEPFVKQFEQQFRASAAGEPVQPAAGFAQAPGGFAQPSPLKAIWDGVTSAAAWTGTGAGQRHPGQATPGQGIPHAAPAGFASPVALGRPRLRTDAVAAGTTGARGDEWVSEPAAVPGTANAPRTVPDRRTDAAPDPLTTRPPELATRMPSARCPRGVGGRAAGGRQTRDTTMVWRRCGRSPGRAEVRFAAENKPKHEARTGHKRHYRTLGRGAGGAASLGKHAHPAELLVALGHQLIPRLGHELAKRPGEKRLQPRGHLPRVAVGSARRLLDHGVDHPNSLRSPDRIRSAWAAFALCSALFQRMPAQPSGLITL